jgi:hypothetical protein
VLPSSALFMADSLPFPSLPNCNIYWSQPYKEIMKKRK